MTVYVDYGKIHSAKVMPDGRIHAYARVARTGQMPYYVQKDGVFQRVMRDVPRTTLFDAKSMRTAESQYVLKGHTADNAEFASPTNLGQVIGHTGSIALAEENADEGFLGLLISITTKDGIDYYNSGNQEFSPEYLCDITQVNGLETQINRDYKGIAVVPMARGGRSLRVKDAFGTQEAAIERCYIDSEYIRDERERWDFPLTSRDSLLVNRFFDHGQLDPTPIILNIKEEMTTLTKTKIGDRVIEHSPECLRDAIELEKDYLAMQQRVADAEAKVKDYKQLQADVVVLTDQNKKLKDAAENAPKAIQEAVQQRIKDAAQCQEDIKVFAANGRNVTAAKDALDRFDIEGYKSAILADMAAPAGVTLDYASVLHSYKTNPMTAKDIAPIPAFQVVAPEGMEMMNGAGMTSSLFGTGLNLSGWNNGVMPADEGDWT